MPLAQASETPPAVLSADRSDAAVTDRTAASAALQVFLCDADGARTEKIGALLREAFGDLAELDIAPATGRGRSARGLPHDICLLVAEASTAEAIETVRSAAAARAVGAVIVLAEKAGIGFSLAAIEAGAADCLPADALTAAALERAVRYALQRRARTLRVEREKETLARDVARLEAYRDADRRFLHETCHDFRTPLAVIKEFAAIMAEGLAGEVNAEQSEFLGIILDRVERISRMVDDILERREAPDATHSPDKARPDKDIPDIGAARARPAAELPAAIGGAGIR